MIVLGLKSRSRHNIVIILDLDRALRLEPDERQIRQTVERLYFTIRVAYRWYFRPEETTGVSAMVFSLLNIRRVVLGVWIPYF